MSDKTVSILVGLFLFPLFFLLLGVVINLLVAFVAWEFTILPWVLYRVLFALGSIFGVWFCIDVLRGRVI